MLHDDVVDGDRRIRWCRSESRRSSDRNVGRSLPLMMNDWRKDGVFLVNAILNIQWKHGTHY